jgi:hypothetical protein
VQPIALSRDHVTARIAADFPRWHVWYDAPNGSYHGRRRGRFRALSEPGAPLYSVAAYSASGLRVLLMIEDAKPPPDGWDC